MSRQFYGEGILGIDLAKLSGKLIVVEGADGSGRSTQCELLTKWLENKGHFVENVGLKRSTLVSEELVNAQKGNILSRRTMGLFYSTDFADQLENTIIPALRAGAIVLSDRYFYTLMARQLVRGAALSWLEKLFGFALIPDAVFYLQVPADALIERNFANNNELNYWESGMDLGLANNSYDSFMIYQKQITAAFVRLQKKYGFTIVDGSPDAKKVFETLKVEIERMV